MQKSFWMVYSTVNDGKLEPFDNYEDAEDAAKRKAVHGDTYVLAPVAWIKQPVPDLEVTKL